MFANRVLRRFAADLVFLQELFHDVGQRLGGPPFGPWRLLRWDAAKLTDEFLG
jgi:hypothetical protein